MDDTKFQAVTQRLLQLSTQYTKGELKHYQYAHEYDKTLEANGVTKKELVAEVDRRLSPNYQAEEHKVIAIKTTKPRTR